MPRDRDHSPSDQVRELRALARRLQHTLDEDSETIAHELFDGLGQELSALSYTVETLKDQADTDSSVAEALADLEPVLARAKRAMKRLIHRFRPPLVSKVGFWHALRGLLHELEQTSGIETQLRGAAPEPALGSVVETGLYFLASEALTNVRLHSRATRVVVTFAQEATEVVFEISDNGIGLPAGLSFHEESVGLIAIRERMARLGGSVHWSSAAGSGTTVTARVPTLRSDEPDPGSVTHNL